MHNLSFNYIKTSTRYVERDWSVGRFETGEKSNLDPLGKYAQTWEMDFNINKIIVFESWQTVPVYTLSLNSIALDQSKPATPSLPESNFTG